MSNPNSLMNRSKSIHDKKNQQDLSVRPLSFKPMKPVFEQRNEQKRKKVPKLSHMMYDPVDTLGDEVEKEQEKKEKTLQLLLENDAKMREAEEHEKKASMKV